MTADDEHDPDEFDEFELNEDTEFEAENEGFEKEKKSPPHEFKRTYDDEKPKASKLSKFLTLLLRHQPQILHLSVDSEGWLSCTVDELVPLINERGNLKDITRQDIEEVVQSDPKRRYEIVDNQIRATYGHSIKGINPLEFPDDIDDLPEYVYYAANNFHLDTMLRLGLIPNEKRDRQLLHLSVEIKDAYTVAKHHSRNPKLVRINVHQAYNYGIKFRRVAPPIVVCEEIPSQFIEEIPLPENLQYLIHLNPERKFQKNRKGYHQKNFHGQNRGYRKGPYKGKNQEYKYPRRSKQDYDRSDRKKPFKDPKKQDDDKLKYPVGDDFNDDLDFDDPPKFGSIDDIKKKAKSKSTIHFETEKDDEVNFD